jgi:hypothetical protein
MRQRLIATLFAIGLALLPANSFADGNEDNEPEHRISEAHEGIEGAELLAAGAAIVLALGIAFTVGRRSRKKS